MSRQSLTSWPLATDFWRNLGRLDLRYVDWTYRVIGPGRLPTAMFSRLYVLGIPKEIVDQTLASIRSLDQWSGAWVETAQHFLGQSRREVSAGNRLEAERARFTAGMCYHAAQIMELRSTVTRDRCRSWAARLVKLALPVVEPDARHIEIPWRDRFLPALFQAPEQGSGPFGLVVLLNGLSMSKEETFLWTPRFLQAGYAVLCLDSPGTGEATSLGPIDANNTDILNGVFTMFADEPGIDLDRVFLVGASLGGNEAVRLAAREPRVLAAVAVTPAVTPARWMNYASALLRAELADANSDERGAMMAEAYDAIPAAESLQQPTLVFGAARDLVVPPNESQLLAQAAGDRATLVWYPGLGHCLYAAMDQWTAEAAAWIGAVGEGSRTGIDDATDLAAIGRDALGQVDYTPIQAEPEWDEDDVGEYARILDPEEVAR